MRLDIIHKRMLIRSEASRFALQWFAAGAATVIACTALMTFVVARLLGH